MSLSTTTRSPEEAIRNILNANRSGVKDLKHLFEFYKTHYGLIPMFNAYKAIVAATETRANLTMLEAMVSFFDEADLRSQLKLKIGERRTLTS